MKKEKKLYRIVSQESELGKLGLSVLLDRGFCGPPYDLSDYSVWIWNYEKSFRIDFYDMNCDVTQSSKFYSKMKKTYEK